MVELRGNVREVVYSEKHWKLLFSKRRKGIELIRALSRCGMAYVVLHGSVARGDVEPDSDVDAALLHPYSPSLVTLCLERHEYNVYSLVIVQPTPVHTPKVYVYLDPYEELVVTIPLAELEPIEIEFYRFSGMVTLSDLERGIRVAGVNKKLVLIEPTDRGHREVPVIGNEGYVARRLGVSINVVLDRVRALTRRSQEGHTGLFIEFEVPPSLSIEEAIEKLCIENKFFRQRVARRGLCS